MLDGLNDDSLSAFTIVGVLRTLEVLEHPIPPDFLPGAQASRAVADPVRTRLQMTVVFITLPSIADIDEFRRDWTVLF